MRTCKLVGCYAGTSQDRLVCTAHYLAILGDVVAKHDSLMVSDTALEDALKTPNHPLFHQVSYWNAFVQTNQFKLVRQANAGRMAYKHLV